MKAVVRKRKKELQTLKKQQKIFMYKNVSKSFHIIEKKTEKIL